MHDLAQEEAHLRMRGNNEMNNGINGGISWMDEPWNTTQSTMNHPTMNIQELLGMAHWPPGNVEFFRALDFVFAVRSAINPIK